MVKTSRRRSTSTSTTKPHRQQTRSFAAHVAQHKPHEKDGVSSDITAFQRGSHGYNMAKQLAAGVPQEKLRKFPKLDNVVRGHWVERTITDFNIVSNLGRELSDEIDELNDGSKVRVEPSQFVPRDYRHVPAVNKLDSVNDERNNYMHHNEMLRRKPEYMTASHKDQKGDNIDNWMAEFRDYIWQPEVQLYQTMPSRARIRLLDENGLSHGAGGRKNSKAQATIKAGSGKIFVNGQPYTEYFQGWESRSQLILPFYSTGTISQFDVFVKVKGGGYTGQSEAAKLAIANALQNFEPEFRPTLKVNNLLKRDPRAVERKHVGHKKARKSFAWVKR